MTNANSATKSRDAVPSIELGVDPVKPRSWATASGSRPRLEPASAPAPYGELSGHASVPVAQPRDIADQRPGVSHQVVAEQYGLGGAGGCGAGHRSRRGAARPGSAIASARSSTIAATTWAWSRRNTLNSVAIWSLRLRPARSLPPRSGPTRSTRAPSSAPWTSSSDSSGKQLTGADAAVELVDAGEERFQLVLGQVAGSVQHPGVRTGTVEVGGRQPPVEVGAPRERHELGLGPPSKRPPERAPGVGAAVLGHGAFRSRSSGLCRTFRDARSSLLEGAPSLGGRGASASERLETRRCWTVGAGSPSRRGHPHERNSIVVALRRRGCWRSGGGRRSRARRTSLQAAYASMQDMTLIQRAARRRASSLLAGDSEAMSRLRIVS